jgi:hypothetical protein
VAGHCSYLVLVLPGISPSSLFWALFASGQIGMPEIAPDHSNYISDETNSTKVTLTELFKSNSLKN